MLKVFKNMEVQVYLSSISKIGIYKCLKTFPALKNLSVSSHYFRNHFKLIKTICKSNEELFL